MKYEDPFDPRHFKAREIRCGSAPDSALIHGSAAQARAKVQPGGTRLLVCGGRSYTDKARVFAALDKLIEPPRRVTVVVHGAAPGADDLADQWARARKIERMPFPVTHEDLKRMGPSSDARRNVQMLAQGKPTAVVAFPGASDDLMGKVRDAGLPIWRPYG